MAGLVPAIHAVPLPADLKVSGKPDDVDDRDKPGHDGVGFYPSAYGDKPGHDGVDRFDYFAASPNGEKAMAVQLGT